MVIIDLLKVGDTIYDNNGATVSSVPVEDAIITLKVKVILPDLKAISCQDTRGKRLSYLLDNPRLWHSKEAAILDSIETLGQHRRYAVKKALSYVQEIEKIDNRQRLLEEYLKKIKDESYGV